MVRIPDLRRMDKCNRWDIRWYDCLVFIRLPVNLVPENQIATIRPKQVYKLL